MPTTLPTPVSLRPAVGFWLVAQGTVGRKVSATDAKSNQHRGAPTSCGRHRYLVCVLSESLAGRSLTSAPLRAELHCQVPQPRVSQVVRSTDMATQQPISQERKVTFKNSSGETLAGTLLDAGSSDAAVLCHGYADSKDGFHLPALAHALANKGCSSLRFDFTGNGESEGQFRYGNYNAEAEDVRSAVHFLQSQGMNIKGILGHSKGGDTVITYAGTYDDISKVVNVSGRFFLDKGITPRFGTDIFDRLKKEKTVQVKDPTVKTGPQGWTLTEEDMNERVFHDMGKLSQAIRKSSVLTIHGASDKTIPFADAHEFSKHIDKHQLVVIDGASHNYDNPQHAKQMIQLAVDYITVA